MRDDSTLIAVAAGLAIVGLLSGPALASLLLRFRKKDQKQETYEDADGKATIESVEAFSAQWAKIVILLSAAAVCATSIALAVLSTSAEVSPLENWLSAGISIALLFQAVAAASARKSVQAYELGINIFFSSLVLTGLLLVQGTQVVESLLRDYPVLFGLRIAEFIAAALLTAASLTIPRRPDVYYHDGKLVDRQYTVSALSRFTFGWAVQLLTVAGKKKNLDMEDLSRPDHWTRAADTTAAWIAKKYTSRLYISVILEYKVAFAIQWILTLCAAMLNFAPQWVMLQLLRILENRHERQETFGLDVWIWVVWLGAAIIAQSWMDSYTFWLSFAQLAIPVRTQLSSLIFEKAMRRKDVKGTGKSAGKQDEAAADATESAEPTVAAAAGESTATDRPEVPEGDDAEQLKKSKQSTVNLIGVDARRISDFCAFQNLFPGSLFKLIVSLVFLVDLLGWQALLAGFSSMLAIMPINIYASKFYAAAQDRLMKVRDEKMEVVTEALQGIRQIKFSALEPDWEAKINAVRERELKSIWSVFLGDTALLSCWVTSPIMLSAVSLAVHALIYGDLKPSVAFVSLGVFKALEVTLSVIPELTTDLLDAWVSINRIEEYLNSPEITVITKPADEIAFEGASIAWPADDKTKDEDRFVLRGLDIKFPNGELSVISGKTGSGKSLMLAALLGEIDLLEGSIYAPQAPLLAERHDGKANKGNWILPGAVAYVAQIPWIENASIRDNIVFGLPYDEERYNKTIEVCALKKDLEMLSDGENTEIGANGINLSGGQKWRVTLARAMYSRAGILILDDIFSAVDAHVGRHIFEQCLNGELSKGRTRILVTHHVALCEPKTKYLVELSDGGVLHAGLVSDLRASGKLQQIKKHEESQQSTAEVDEGQTAVNSPDDSTDGDEETDGNTLKKVTSKQVAKKFVEEEGREQGAVSRHVYTTYLSDSGGAIYWAVALAIFSSSQLLVIGRSWWLKVWTSHDESESLSIQHIYNASREHGFAYTVGVQQTSIHWLNAPERPGQDSFWYYLKVYVALALVSSVIGSIKYWYIYLGSIRASRKLFEKINFVVLRAPLRWLDTVPMGRILNRFTADFSIIDSQLANVLSFGANSFLGLITVVIAGFIVNPYIVLGASFLLLICLYYAIRYLDGARPVKRLESNTKSPVFEQFGSALTGVTTIRGFGKGATYIERMYNKLDDYATATWHLWLFNRWMGWRMSLVGSFFASFVAILLLLTPNVDSALAGFALAFALDFSSSVVWTIRMYANIELNMNAAERIIEYTELPTESLEGSSPPAAWPTDGRIEVDDLVVGYAPGLPPVLKGLTFSVDRNERIGVVGRTGAGKSSLTLALFRFLEARSGSIHIDGLDISKIKLHDLRSRLAIIPQDPVLFSGTVRSNLDPFDHQTDAALRDCLERVHLINNTATNSGTATPTAGASSGTMPKNSNVFEDLRSSISEGGLNLSQGQRQLLCLARAIVSRPRIMVLDEATSAVDMHTDALIQRSIREEFNDATLIVIAHRLSTIADFDRILVLSDGQVAEYGTPRDLWEKTDGEGPGGKGIFRAMCEESGEKEKLEAIVFGKTA